MPLSYQTDHILIFRLDPFPSFASLVRIKTNPYFSSIYFSLCVYLSSDCFLVMAFLHWSFSIFHFQSSSFPLCQ